MKLYLKLTVTTIILSAFVNIPESFKKISREEAISMALQIQNYKELSYPKQNDLKKAIFIWENTKAIQSINYQNRLPHSLLFITKNPLDVNPISPSPFSKRPVCWLPDLDLFYELMLVNHNMHQLYGEAKCPSIYLVMALISHETYMRDIQGDNQLSIGMCQLYKPTAKYLINNSSNKDIFNKLIYFDENGDQHFFSQKAMLEFIYHFLILEKGYKHHNPKIGVKAYNGAGKKADNYAKNVLLKAMFYEALTYKLKSNEPILATKGLKEWSKAPLSSTFIDFNGFHNSPEDINSTKYLNQEESKEIERLKFSIIQYVNEIENKRYKPNHDLSTLKPLNIFLERNPENTQFNDETTRQNSNLKRKFFILEKGRSVYSYLKENTFKVMTTCNSYDFYYLEYDKKHLVKTEDVMRKSIADRKVILSNASVGDTVYFDHYPVFGLGN